MVKRKEASKVKKAATPVIKQKVKITSKIKKRFKFTLKKLNLDNDTLYSAIQALQLHDKDHKENAYAYIILNEDITNDNQNIKKVNNKLIKLPLPLGREICLINDDFNDTERLTLEGSGRVSILDKSELDTKVKKLTASSKLISHLNSKFQMIIANNKLNFHINRLLGKAKKKIDVLYYQKRDVDYITKLITLINKGATLINKIDNRTFCIKCSPISPDKQGMITNIKSTLYKSVSLILENAQKHNTVRCIVIKSESSLPYVVQGDMKPEDIDYFE